MFVDHVIGPIERVVVVAGCARAAVAQGFVDAGDVAVAVVVPSGAGDFRRSRGRDGFAGGAVQRIDSVSKRLA
ncbi:MAG TPA: hypothetical protein VFN13_06835, partial [Rudaea sp.]|nr:hypothetical protein [Rudaea sp.]